LFYCTDWSSVHSVEGGVAGVQLDGGQDGVTAGGGGDSGGSSSVGDGGGGESGGSSVGERETGSVGVGKASNGRSSDHSRGRGRLISGPLAISDDRVGISDNGGGGDLMGDLSGGDHIRLDNRGVGNSADRSEGGDGGGESSGVGQTSIGVSQKLGLGLCGPFSIESRVGISDNGGSGDLVGDLSGGDHIRLDNRGVGNSADRSEGGDGGGESSGVGQTSIGISQKLGLGLSLLPVSGGGSSSIESSLELSLGSDHLSSVLNRGGTLEVEHGGHKGGDLWGSRGGGSYGEVGGGNPEAIHGVGHIVDSLEEAISINVLVTAGGHAIRVPRLGLG